MIHPDKMLVLVGGRIGQVLRSGNLKSGCFGYWVMFRPDDPGQNWAYPAFTQHIRPAVLGETVCRRPRGLCWCGLAHIPASEIGWLAS